ncbi:hypothetical protein BJX66DRAFT_274872 [Aspergillus keveii]|uniref:Uncharacterized protein n=1 Tax=Aspergillus keveii TaxID=714993 RepID=A0ABR4GJG6_9EURO
MSRSIIPLPRKGYEPTSELVLLLMGRVKSSLLFFYRGIAYCNFVFLVYMLTYNASNRLIVLVHLQCN